MIRKGVDLNLNSEIYVFLRVVCVLNYVLIVKELIKVGVNVKLSFELDIVLIVVLDYFYLGIV